MRYVGVALIFLGAYLASRKNSERERERLELLLGYESFIREMRSRAANLLEAVPHWVGKFECPALERAGFLSAVRRGERLTEAFAVASEGLPEGARESILTLFSHTGATLDDEIARIDAALATVGRIADEQSRESRERSRLFSVLALGISAGVGILVL